MAGVWRMLIKPRKSTKLHKSREEAKKIITFEKKKSTNKVETLACKNIQILLNKFQPPFILLINSTLVFPKHSYCFYIGPLFIHLDLKFRGLGGGQLEPCDTVTGKRDDI